MHRMKLGQEAELQALRARVRKTNHMREMEFQRALEGEA